MIRKNLLASALLSGVMLLCAACAWAGPTKVTDLRTQVGEAPGQAAFSWKIRDSRPNVLQTAYRIDVAASPKDLRRGRNLVWSSGRIEDGHSLYIPYEGPQLAEGTRYWWKVTVWTNRGKENSSQGTSWINGLSPEAWGAQWIGIDDPQDIVRDDRGRTSLPARYLRKTFNAPRKVKSATLFVCGLGSSVCWLNGQQVGDDVFGPLPTWYPASELYLTYDVTRLMHKGNNALAVALGNGRFMGMRPNRSFYFGVPRLIARLDIVYRNGERESIVSDGSWAVTKDGPITKNNEFDGESYDARKELGDWTTTAYDQDSRWRSADILDAPGGVLRAQMSPCLRVQDHLTPAKVWRAPDGRVLLDMGQNMVGWLKVRLRGHEGQPVTLRFAEVLEPQDSCALYTENLRSALVTDEYIPASDGAFEWEPTFVYHGFRFVEIHGLDYLPAATDFDGKVIYDAMQTTGSFESSDEILNAIHRNAFWGIRGNYRGMPTDCPQRDERMGWLGDRGTGCYGEAFLLDNEYVYNKWALDIEESMREDGCVCNVSPHYYNTYRGDVTWPAAFLYCTDMLYTHYGNAQAVQARYPAMKRWVEFIERESMADGIVVKDQYGDWCMPPESPELIHAQDPTRITPGPVLGSTVFYDLLGKMQGFARIAGHPEDVPVYAELAARLKKAYNEKYFNAEGGFYANNTVTGNILSLHLGLVPEGFERKVMDNILAKTEGEWDSHVSVGVLGIQHLMRGLTENGAEDLAFRLASCDTYPSWGYMIRRGATTIWELWNGDTADPAMNSHNHVMLLGDLLIWFYEDLAGIKAASPGFKEIEMAPVFPSGLDRIKASYDSPYGTISSAWEIRDGRLEWDIEVPANTTATVRVPLRFGACLEGALSSEIDGEDRVFSVGSGRWHVTGVPRKLIAMDLDGTLTEHRTPMDSIHRVTLDRLGEKYQLLMVGGGNATRIHTQMGGYPIEILGNYGMSHGKVVDGEWKLVEELQAPVDTAFILEKCQYFREKYGYTKYYGDPVEFHPSGMVTFGLLGTKAPKEEKLAFDVDKKKRQAMFPEVCEVFKDYAVFIGGSTSFDLAPKEFNKYDAIVRYAGEHGISLDEILFYGDDMTDGGNDSHVRLGDLDYVWVHDYRDFPALAAPLLK